MRQTCFVLFVCAVLVACREQGGAEEALLPTRPLQTADVTFPVVERARWRADAAAETPVSGGFVTIHGLPRAPTIVLRAHAVDDVPELTAYIWSADSYPEPQTKMVRWVTSGSAIGIDIRGDADRAHRVSLRGMEDALDTGGREPNEVVFACVDGMRPAHCADCPPVLCSAPLRVDVVPDLAGTWRLTLDDQPPREVTLTQDSRQICGLLEGQCGTITGTTIDINDGFDRWQGRLGSDRRTITGQLVSEDGTLYGEWRAERIDR